MKIIAQRAKDLRDGFHEIGTTHQFIFTNYQSVETAVRYGISIWARGRIVRCLVFSNDNVYADPDFVFYYIFGKVMQRKEIEKRILNFLPRENALGFTARQIATELHLEPDVAFDTIESMMQRKLLTYDATGYCWKGEKRHIT